MGVLKVSLYVITSLYDCTTIAFYYLWELYHRDNYDFSKQAKIVSREDDTITLQSTRKSKSMRQSLIDLNLETMYEIFSHCVKKNPHRRCLGSRRIISEEDVKEAGGIQKKYFLADQYDWKTYSEVDGQATAFISGLLLRGLKPGDKLCIFAETREEWLIAAVAAFKQRVGVVTLYANLGLDALKHGILETQCSFFITSHELLPRLLKLKDDIGDQIKCLVYMEDKFSPTNPDFFSNVAVPFKTVVAEGKKSSEHNYADTPPHPDDLAILMYTSGSTGIPKGVQMTHKNIAYSMRGTSDIMGMPGADETYLAYLPLAHIAELISEFVSFFVGFSVAYSSPFTLTDKGPRVQQGCKGDAQVARPTFMFAVPLIMEKLAKGIREEISKSPVKKELVDFFYNYKRKWFQRGFKTPLTDALIFKKTRMILGGRVKLLVTGGAPLSPETQEFLQMVLCTPILPAYGSTETSACTSAAQSGDRHFGRIGPPLQDAIVKLVDWKESGYSVNDKPNPRGEIVVGGETVSKGYYNISDNSLYEDDGGIRWFRTGDIAELHSDGSLEIIDRKKDIVKLQMGEYISYGKIEVAIKTNPLVDNFCVYADPLKSYCVGIMVPVEKKLLELVDTNLDFASACRDQKVTDMVLDNIRNHARSNHRLEKFEIPRKIFLTPEPWTPENGLVTAAFKIRRAPVYQKFSKEIQNLYQ